VTLKVPSRAEAERAARATPPGSLGPLPGTVELSQLPGVTIDLSGLP